MRRGESGLSLLIGVKKPIGMSSHDVVNRCRGIFGEKRVGHTGTLDPLASGVLPICVGPATRLDAYMVGHDKEYRVAMRFGFETNTDDIAGEVVKEASVPAHLDDMDFANSYIASLAGSHEQVPPQYSAIKVNGKRAYALARKGDAADLKPRTVTIYEAEVDDVRRDEDGLLVWDARFSVSKGTYIRSLARDIGRALGTAAHVAALERTRSGRIYLEQCVSLETLEVLKEQAAIDPVRALGVRYAFADEYASKLSNGSRLRSEDVQLYERLDALPSDALCACSTFICKSYDEPIDGELVAMVVENRLKALYAFAAESCLYKPATVFAVPITRA